MSEIKFFKFLVTKHVFYKSKHTFALVNLKPLVPGHVLIVPLRNTALRLADLTPEESIDYMQVIQLIHRFIQKTYKADALNIAIQDGPESGQSVPHLHTHILPRFATDGFGDGVYKMIEEFDAEKYYEEFDKRKEEFRKNIGAFSEKIPSDDDRRPRTPEEMEKEAQWLAGELEKFVSELDTSKVAIPEQ
ncbi:bis(5'-adenosyl)-triphosphatase [[Candida] railenensis]|uniref:Bis(5'-adenosyl)-triphosphatase n=1 Tax=[Candida] railenensis TaxID=45579 RepID=A0A9P0VXF8_9ASCO|nr:bis(5'-adenosyl)-triphosphatase [[Candida] railenensis]